MCAANSSWPADLPIPIGAARCRSKGPMRFSTQFYLIGLIAVACTWSNLVCAESATSEQKLDFYISPHGDDNWSGRLPEPNSARTDGPLATLDQARLKVRAARS